MKKSKVVKGPDLKVKVKQLNQCVQDKDWEKADELATKLLLSYPNNWDVLVPAAEAKFHLPGAEHDALKFIDRAVKSAPSPDVFLQIAIDRLKMERLTDAESITKSITDKYHKCLLAFEILGIALKRQGRYQESIDAFKKAIAIDKKSLTVWMNMGNAYIAWNKHSKSLECFTEALLIDPHHKESTRLQGVSCIGIGDNARAVAILTRALSAEPSSALIRHDLAAAHYNMQDYDKALEVVKQGLVIEPGNVGLIRIGNAISRRL